MKKVKNFIYNDEVQEVFEKIGNKTKGAIDA